jgi:hypothetical protein
MVQKTLANITAELSQRQLARLSLLYKVPSVTTYVHSGADSKDAAAVLLIPEQARHSVWVLLWTPHCFWPSLGFRLGWAHSLPL